MTNPTPETTPTRDEAVLYARYEPEWGRMMLCNRDQFGAVEYRLASAPAPASGGVDAKTLRGIIARWETRREYLNTNPSAYDAFIAREIAGVSEPPLARQALSPDATPVSEAGGEPFQQRVQPWMMACFGAEISADVVERNHRFLEEALELVQSTGCTASEAHQLVDYVFGRDVGETHQEIGGVMVTLAALCLALGEDMHAAGETELARIWTKVEKIRAKQAAKPKHSPLPQALAKPASSPAGPGHTDLMVMPESLDAFLSCNSPPDMLASSGPSSPAGGGDLVAWVESLPREPTPALRAAYEAYKAAGLSLGEDVRAVRFVQKESPPLVIEDDTLSQSTSGGRGE